VKNEDGTTTENILYMDKDTISGEVSFDLKEFNIESFEHNGIAIELIGTFISSDGTLTELIHLQKELDSPRSLTKNVSFGFSFKEVNLPYESFKGKLGEVKYMLKASITKPFLNTKSYEEQKFIVVSAENNNIINPSIKADVVFSNFLNLEISFFQTNFNLIEAVCGSVRIGECNLQLTAIELLLLRKENHIGIKNYEEEISKFQIVEGCPEPNDIIPFRMFLSHYELSPTYKLINNVYSVQYYIKLVCVDRDNKNYSYLQEIILNR